MTEPWSGHRVNMNCASLLKCDWTGDGNYDEYFAIDEYRRIRHAWRGSNGWALMPNNGRADDTYACLWVRYGNTWTHAVEVRVIGAGIFRSHIQNGAWTNWYLV